MSQVKQLPAFKRFVPTYQQEYLVWFSTAKQPAKHERRLKAALTALAKDYKCIDGKRT